MLYRKAESEAGSSIDSSDRQAVFQREFREDLRYWIRSGAGRYPLRLRLLTVSLCSTV